MQHPPDVSKNHSIDFPKNENNKRLKFYLYKSLFTVGLLFPKDSNASLTASPNREKLLKVLAETISPLISKKKNKHGESHVSRGKLRKID